MAPPKMLTEVPVVDLDYTPTTAGGKTKEVHINVAAFHDQWLGKQLTPVGKCPVLLGMVNAGVEPDKKVASVLGQQRYVQEFGNAMALFVDLQGGTNRSNVFQAAGHGDQRVVFFRWFAWNSWKLRGPYAMRVHRLQHVVRGDKRFILRGAMHIPQQSTRTDEPLLLFVQNSATSPYVYCGRLTRLGMRATQPLEFRWQLLDTHALSWMNGSPQVNES